MCKKQRLQCWNKCVSNETRRWLHLNGPHSRILEQTQQSEAVHDGGRWIDCVRLDEALKAAVALRDAFLGDRGQKPRSSFVELLSLDVDGHEWEVLSTVDWDQWHIDVVIIEAFEPYNSKSVRDDYKVYFEERGYRYVDRTWDDLIFKKVASAPCHHNLEKYSSCSDAFFDDGTRGFFSYYHAFTDYWCPVETLHDRITHILTRSSLAQTDGPELNSVINLVAKNMLLWSLESVINHSTAQSFTGPPGTRENLFGERRLLHPEVGIFPTSTFWLYHVAFVDIVRSDLPLFLLLDELVDVTIGLVIEQDSARMHALPGCHDGALSIERREHAELDLVIWTCSVLPTALHHANQALLGNATKHLGDCEALVKEYSRRFGLPRLLLWGQRWGL